MNEAPPPVGFPPIEDIAPLPPSPAEAAMPWIFWVCAGVLAALALLALFFVIRSLVRRFSFPSLPPAPEKEALRALKVLQREADSLAPADFAGRLGGVIKLFFHRHFGLMANFMTSEEITRTGDEHGAVPPVPPAAAGFSSILTACDRLKFAGPGTGDSQARAMLISETINAIRDAHRGPQVASVPPPNPLPA